MPEQPPARILLVDDNEPNRYAVARVLRGTGFEVWECGGGAEALRLAGENPDLVILDINLPDISGLEVCRRLKSDPATERIPVLCLSASRIGMEHRVQGLEVGADGYLVQPVEPPELVATINALLRARRAEERVRASAREWQATFDSIRDGVCLISDGIILRCNRAMAEILPYSPGEIQGRPYDARVPAGLREIAEPLLRRVQETGLGESAEGEFQGRWFRISADPVQDENGSITGVVQVLTDITDLKYLEAAARQRAEELTDAARAKDEFLAMLGHELRNPLGALSNAVHLLELENAPETLKARQRAILRRQLAHVTRLVDDLLDVSRITRGKVDLRLEPTELNAVVQNAVQSVAPLVQESRHELITRIPPEPIHLIADPTRLEQVVSNLLHNAAKYTDPGGRIWLSVEVERPENSASAAPTVSIRVRDNGTGIDPELLPRIFDLFHQADQTLDRSRGGLGIGLTLVRSLVEMHGGRITAHSDGPGRGSEFVVTLPLPTEAGKAPAPDAAPVRAGGTRESGPRKIVVVEDQEDARETLADLLELWGHRVETAAEGRAGIQRILEGRPDVALIDIGLPGVDGYEVARVVREDPATRGTRLIALTGYGQEEDRRRALAAGFDHHLTKPIDPDALRDYLQ